MHKVTKITLAAGFLLFFVSAIATSGGFSSFMNEMTEEAEIGGTEIWTGETPATFEGQMHVTSLYPVFVQEGRSVDVEVVDGDVNSRFVPCEEDFSCGSFYEPGYTYVGDVTVSYSDTWKVRFSGDVVGGSDVMIRELNMDMPGLMSLSFGCMGVCFSLLLIGLGVIFAFTLKDNSNNPTPQVTMVNGNTPPPAETNTGDWWNQSDTE